MKKNQILSFLFVISLLLITVLPVMASQSKDSNDTNGNSLFSDNFQKNTIGSQWQVIDDPFPSSGPSSWKIEGGKLGQLSNIYRSQDEYSYWQGTHIVAGSPQWSNYVFTFDLMSKDDDGIGAIMRYQDQDNYYRFIMVNDPGNKGPFRRLEKFVNGQRTVLAESKDGFKTQQTYHVKLVALGSRLEVWLDGKKVLSAQDDTFPSGKIGFLSYADEGMFISHAKVSKI